MQLLPNLSKSLLISTINNKYDSLHRHKIVPPELAQSLLASQIPHFDINILEFELI